MPRGFCVPPSQIEALLHKSLDRVLFCATLGLPGLCPAPLRGGRFLKWAIWLVWWGALSERAASAPRAAILALSAQWSSIMGGEKLESAPLEPPPLYVVDPVCRDPRWLDLGDSPCNGRPFVLGGVSSFSVKGILGLVQAGSRQELRGIGVVIWVSAGIALLFALLLIIDAIVTWRRNRRVEKGELFVGAGKPSLLGRMFRRLFYPPPPTSSTFPAGPSKPSLASRAFRALFYPPPPPGGAMKAGRPSFGNRVFRALCHTPPALPSPEASSFHKPQPSLGARMLRRLAYSPPKPKETGVLPKRSNPSLANRAFRRLFYPPR